MIESLCLELLISGLLVVNSPQITVDNNNIHYVENKGSYVVPKKTDLLTECENQVFSEDVSNKMKSFVSTNY